MGKVKPFCSASGLFTLAFAAILHENLHGRMVFLPGKTPEALVIREKADESLCLKKGPTSHFCNLKRWQEDMTLHAVMKSKSAIKK